MNPTLHRVFTVTIASGATTSTNYVDIGGYKQAWLEIPTMATATVVKLLAAYDSAGTFRVVTQTPLNTLTTASETNVWTVASAVGAVGGFVPIPIGLRYMKVNIGTVVTDVTKTFRVICS